nr:hypothetical protein CFP56_34872 [Quercus suber]
MPAKAKKMRPGTQPASFIAKGSARSPTPIRTLTLLKMVWGSVDWPTTTLTTFPSSSCTCLTNRGSRSLSGSETPFCCCCRNRRPACRMEGSLTREASEPQVATRQRQHGGTELEHWRIRTAIAPPKLRPQLGLDGYYAIIVPVQRSVGWSQQRRPFRMGARVGMLMCTIMGDSPGCGPGYFFVFILKHRIALLPTLCRQCFSDQCSAIFVPILPILPTLLIIRESEALPDRSDLEEAGGTLPTRGEIVQRIDAASLSERVDAHGHGRASPPELLLVVFLHRAGAEVPGLMRATPVPTLLIPGDALLARPRVGRGITTAALVAGPVGGDGLSGRRHRARWPGDGKESESRGNVRSGQDRGRRCAQPVMGRADDDHGGTLD